MIDCDTVLELAGNYENEELIEPLRNRIDRHLAQCPACAHSYRAQQELVHRLHQAQPARQAGAWFADRLLSRLAQDNDALLEVGVHDPAQLSFTEL